MTRRLLVQNLVSSLTRELYFINLLYYIVFYCILFHKLFLHHSICIKLFTELFINF